MSLASTTERLSTVKPLKSVFRAIVVDWTVHDDGSEDVDVVWECSHMHDAIGEALTCGDRKRHDELQKEQAKRRAARRKSKT